MSIEWKALPWSERTSGPYKTLDKFVYKLLRSVTSSVVKTLNSESKLGTHTRRIDSPSPDGK